MTDIEKIAAALAIAIGYGQTDGAHHKLWVIDQMLRMLAGDDYESVIARYPGEWDCGIAP